MRKKLVLLILSGIICFPLGGCGKISAEAQEVIDEIDSIDDVSLEDESLISQIENDYLELTEEQQKEVKNLEKLSEAREEIDNLYAEEVISNIDSIGTVELDDDKLIKKIEEQYNSLSESQKEKVTNISTLNSAKEELDELIAATAIPFCKAKWDFTQDELIAILGKPDDEYDNDYYGHILLYSNVEYEGFHGDTKYCFENGKLTRVFFSVDNYDQHMIDYFDNIFSTKYGEPNYKDEYGNKRWDTEYALYAIEGGSLFGGYVDIIYISPQLGGH